MLQITIPPKNVSRLSSAPDALAYLLLWQADGVCRGCGGCYDVERPLMQIDRDLMDGAMNNASDSGAKMVSPCPCSAVGQGVQTFRIQRPSVWFKPVAELSPAPQLWLSARSVWACLHCGQLFAWMRIPYKDEEEIIVRAETDDYADWDWAKLAQAADDCRWRGPGLDVRYVL